MLISVDALRADHLGAYGYLRATSPAIDALASVGVRYNNALSASEWTLPSHASLLTGLWPDQHGANSQQDLRRIPAGVYTLAERLRAAGYATGGFAGGRWLTPRFGFDQGFDVWGNDDAWEASIQDAAHRFGPARQWLDGLETGRPFFLFVHLYQVHDPYLPPPALMGRFATAPADPMALARPFGDHLPRPDELRAQIALYDADVLATDQAVGQFLRWLDDSGLREDTLIVFTADHGEEFFDHGGTGHGQQHAELLRVPLLMDHPALRQHAARVVDAPTPSVDVVPTMLDLLGLEADPALPGGSRVPDMATQLVRERVAFSGTAHGPGVRAAAWSETHHVVAQDGVRQSYDAVSDPRETADIGYRSGHAAEHLSGEIDAWLSALEPAAPWEPVELDSLTEEQLRALGYLR